jgi:hypothetical protein
MSARIALLALLLVPLHATAASASKRHRPLDAAGALEACEACHAQATPAAVTAWEGSAHGLTLVKCFVCHGSTGKDFQARGTAASCDGCHPAQAAVVVRAKDTRAPRAAACFACHAPHTLAVPQGKANPHAAP